MVEIKLASGVISIVDDEDADLLSMRWHLFDGYARHEKRLIGKQKFSIFMHQIVLSRKIGRKLSYPRDYTDHISGNKLDNRRSNLRLSVRNSPNSFNRPKNKNNTSGYRGVTWRKDKKKWRAQIKYHRMAMFLGHFPTKELAYEAYKKKAKELFGEFADRLE
jgi:hypothetical protein